MEKRIFEHFNTAINSIEHLGKTFGPFDLFELRTINIRVHEFVFKCVKCECMRTKVECTSYVSCLISLKSQSTTYVRVCRRNKIYVKFSFLM